MKLMFTVCEWVEVPQSHAISAAKNVRAEIQHVNKALFLCLCSSKQFRKYIKKNFSCLYRPANPLRNVTSSRSNAVNRPYWFHLISFQRVALSIVLKGKSEELKKKKKAPASRIRSNIRTAPAVFIYTGGSFQWTAATLWKPPSSTSNPHEQQSHTVMHFNWTQWIIQSSCGTQLYTDTADTDVPLMLELWNTSNRIVVVLRVSPL